MKRVQFSFSREWQRMSALRQECGGNVEGKVKILGHWCAECREKFVSLPLDMAMKITEIGDYAFSSCTGLKTIELPYKIQAIDNLAFSGCSALTAVTSFSPTPSALGHNPFNGVSKSIPVTVQGNSLNAYQHDSWGGFTNFVATPTK